MKPTWKRRGISTERIQEALRASRTLAEAARSLGVDRSTLFRWIEREPSLKSVHRERAAAAEQATQAAEVLKPDAWSRAMAAAYPFTETERVMLDLARRALRLAQDTEARPSDRLAAMGRFQRLVEHLRLDAPRQSEGAARKTPAAPVRPEASARLLDPRSVLRAVS